MSLHDWGYLDFVWDARLRGYWANAGMSARSEGKGREEVLRMELWEAWRCDRNLIESHIGQ